MNEYLEIEKSLGDPLNAYDHPTTLSHRFARIQLPLGEAYYLPLGQPPAVCSHETAPILHECRIRAHIRGAFQTARYIGQPLSGGHQALPEGAQGAAPNR